MRSMIFRQCSPPTPWLSSKAMYWPSLRTRRRRGLHAPAVRSQPRGAHVDCARNPGAGAQRDLVSTVTFRALDDAEITRYCATPEPYDKAGGYGIRAWPPSSSSALKQLHRRHGSAALRDSADAGAGGNPSVVTVLVYATRCARRTCTRTGTDRLVGCTPERPRAPRLSTPRHPPCLRRAGRGSHSSLHPPRPARRKRNPGTARSIAGWSARL